MNRLLKAAAAPAPQIMTMKKTLICCTPIKPINYLNHPGPQSQRRLPVDFVELEELPKNTGSLPYQIRHRKDHTVELIISLDGGCVRIWGATEAEVINRYHTRNK